MKFDFSFFQELKSHEIGHWYWKSHEKFLIFASVILINQDTESVIFPVTFVFNYWNCLCVSHKLNYLLLFSNAICSSGACSLAKCVDGFFLFLWCWRSPEFWFCHLGGNPDYCCNV